MPDRAGYQVSVYAIDVSASMGELIDDPAPNDGSTSKQKSKLDFVKEFVARKCEPKITSGRKTEHIGMLSFGGKTNNQANRAYIQSNPEDEDPPYAAVACDVAIQTAKPKAVEVVMNLEVGQEEGNPVSALMVALDMIQTHQHTKSWALEVVLVTDGESSFSQDEYEDAMSRLDELGVKLTVIGIGFNPADEPVDKSKSRNKRLSEKFWRTFIDLLHEKVSSTTDSVDMLPDRQVFDEALALVRMPRPTIVNGTVSGIDLHIGSADVDPDQAIRIPIKYSKATMKARPPSLSKAWKAAVDLQGPQPGSGGYRDMGASQLMASVTEQSQGQGGNLDPSDIAAMISAEVKQHSTYVVKKQAPEPTTQATQATQASQVPASQVDPDFVGPDEPMPGAGAEEAEEEFVAKEDIVKAWRFGSTWVPMEVDMFEPLVTTKGVETLNFIPTDHIKRHHLIGEVRYIWPDITSSKAQIQFASLIEAMKNKGMSAVVRWVLKDQAEPVIGICVPMYEFPGEGKRIDYMFWAKLPFAEDEHQFWFPSLTTLKTEGGKIVKDHPLLPTKEQCNLMDDLVEGMDLDRYAAKHLAEDEGAEEDDDDKRLVMERDNDKPRWFEPTRSFNPVIHRIKEAIFHASLASDLDSDPLPPPHPELTKYFNTPEEIVDETAKVVSQLKDALNVKKVPPKQRKRFVKEGLGEDEGFIDIDDLFNEEDVKAETTTPNKGGGAPAPDTDVKDEITSPLQNKSTPKPKPKKGRLVSNEAPLDDFHRLIEGEGDVFRKAIQDLGEVVKENVAASFSRQAFPLAIECLKAMRETALMYEEVETYNEYLGELESCVKNPDFKHKDFWSHFEKANLGLISDEEARKALEDE